MKFTNGHIPWHKGTKGLKLAPKTAFKKGMTSWNKDKKMPQFSGSNHPKWKGDNIKYGTLHDWIRRKLGRPSKCGICGTSESKRLEWSNISGEYKRDVSDFRSLCVKCHRKVDNNPIGRLHL